MKNAVGTLLALCLVAPCTAQASLTTFFGEDPLGSLTNTQAARTDFMNHVDGVGTESFEEFASGTYPSLDLTFPGSTGDITATLISTVEGDQMRILATTGAGRYPTAGTQYLDVNSNGLRLTFSSPISAFFFDGTDIGDFGGELTLELQTTAGTELLPVRYTIGSLGSTDGQAIGFGFISSNPVTEINFINTWRADYFGYDQMTIADAGQVTPGVAPVPLPPALLLFGSGLLSVGALRRTLRAGKDGGKK